MTCTKRYKKYGSPFYLINKFKKHSNLQVPEYVCHCVVHALLLYGSIEKEEVKKITDSNSLEQREAARATR